MKVPRWKIYLSYLTELHLESSSSEYNEELHVTLYKGRIMLSTANAIYSYADKYDNFLDSFQRMNPALEFKDVLLLGFGLGSIPYMLENNFKRNYHYTGVEIDEEVIYLASKYVVSELKSDIHMVCADAMSFLVQDESKYDLICMDVFESDVIPSQFETTDFLQMLADSLAENGVLMFNRLSFNEMDKKLTSEFYTDIFKRVFPTAGYLEVKGNWMLFNNREVIN